MHVIERSGTMYEKRLDLATIKSQIESLLAQYPDLATDDVLRVDTFQGETDLFEFVAQLEQRRADAQILVDGLDAKLKQMRERRKRFLDRDEALRRIIFNVMNFADVQKIELPDALITIRKGTAKVIILDEAAIPDALCRITREPDKLAIKEALKNENDFVPGAALSNAEPVLVIKNT
jgi:hypothetical protein